MLKGCWSCTKLIIFDYILEKTLQFCVIECALTYTYRHTNFKQLTVCVQFPENYPEERLLVELKSKTIPKKLVDGLVSVCDQELLKHKGQAQVYSESWLSKQFAEHSVCVYVYSAARYTST